jgi:hypothetical protein
MEDDDDNNIPD